MKKFLLTILFLCLIAVLFFFLASKGNFDIITSLGDNTKNKNTIYIGVYEPLTGDYSAGGLSELQGIRYANSIRPTVEIDGVTYNIELVETDCNEDDENSAPAAAELANSGIIAVMGAYSSKANVSGLPEFEKNGLPVIGISCSSLAATSGSSRYFRLCTSDSFQSGVMANFAYGMELRHAAVLTQTGDKYSKEAGRAFAQAFEQFGGDVTFFDFQLRQENFRSLADEIADSKADFVYMLSGSSEATYFIRQSREEGLIIPILGTESWDSGLLVSKIDYSFQDVYFASEFDSSESSDPVSIEFGDRFSSWLNNSSTRIEENGGAAYTSSSAALAYDGYMLLVKAIRVANSKDPQAICDALRTLTYDGVTGTISFDEDGNSISKQAYIKKINTSRREFEVLQTSLVGGA